MFRTWWSNDRHSGVEQDQVRLDEGWIRYRVAGAGEPLVLVHGLGGSNRWWGRNVTALAEHFRVYVVDLKGFGGSRSGRLFELDEAANGLIQWLDHLAIPRAAFIGHSMGGYIVAHLAADHPDRVARLVLVNAALLPLDLRPIIRPRSFTQALRHIPLSLLPTIILDGLRAGGRTLYRAVRSLCTHTFESRLGQVQTPTLIVWGELDTVVPLTTGQRLVNLLPQARLVVLPGAGHNAMWERSAEFNRLVVDFLRHPEPEAARMV